MPKKRELELAESLIPNVPKMQAELVEPDVLEAMSLSEYNKQKEIIKIKRDQLRLVLDGRKLDQAEKIINNMDMILDRIAQGFDPESVSAMDLKCLADAYDKQQKSLDRISRMDSLNGEGDAAFISVEVRFGNRG